MRDEEWKFGVNGLGPEVVDREGSGVCDNAGVEASWEEGAGLPIPLDSS